MFMYHSPDPLDQPLRPTTGSFVLLRVEVCSMP
jgi:hypothetical protein